MRSQVTGRRGLRSLLVFCFLAAVSLLPADAQVSREQLMAAREHINRGNVMLGRQQFAEAIAAYETALDIDPSNVVARDNIVLAHNNWGIFLFKQRKYEDAQAEWEMALRLDPYNKNAKYNLAILKQTVARQAPQEQVDKPAGVTGQSGAAGKPAKTKPSQSENKAAQGQPETNQASSVVILTPGLKASGTATTPQESPQPGDALPSGAESSPQGGTATYGSSLPAGVPQSNSGSFEDQLASIELKIYGQRQLSLPILKRLEKLEVDSAGQVRSGTVKERIDYLKKSYGL